MKLCFFITGLFFLSVLGHAQGQQGEDEFTTTIRGNQELPEIVYIVPWATPPGPGQVDPLVPHSGNVFQRTFTLVERLEVQRKMRYYSQERASKSQ